MKLATRDIENFLRDPPAACRVFLFYGPDEGQSRQRAQARIEKILGPTPNPFALVELAAANVADNAQNLLDEAQNLPLGGDKKVIYLRQAGDTLSAVLEPVLAACPDHARIVIEAGELGPKSALRQLCETAAVVAVAIPAYAAEGAELVDFVQNYLRQRQCRIEAEAMPILLPQLSGNRGISAQILENLILYAHPATTITAAIIDTVLVNQADWALDDAIDAAFSGRADLLQPALTKLAGEGQSGVALLRAAARHALRLLQMHDLLARGTPQEAALKMLRPPVFFKRQRPFLMQLRRFAPKTLLRLNQRLQTAEIQAKTGWPAEILAAQILLGLCLQAQK